MENRSGRFRKKKVNFSMVSNSIIRDGNISLKAKGLYALIQSYITLENFTLYKSFLQSKCREGKKAFESAWQELKRSGYLVQYRMQDVESKQFYWEYELLDDIEPLPQKGCNGSRDDWQADSMENRCNNNTLVNKPNLNNTYPIISSADVMEQIGYNTFDDADKQQIDGIVMLIVEILNMKDDKTIKIAKTELSIRDVKARFLTLNQFHIEYVLECLKQNTVRIGNIKNYLLTALFNAPSTIDTYYQNRVNHDLYGK